MAGQPAADGSILKPKSLATFILKCEHKAWKFHPAVLCKKSKFFEKACESTFKEGLEKTITLHEDEPEIIHCMWLWCYGQDYLRDFHSESEPLSHAKRAVIDAELYAIADKYDVEGLKEAASRELELHLETALFGVRKDPKDLSDVLEAVEMGYTLTPSSDRGARDAIMKSLGPHYSRLIKNEEFQEFHKSGLADGEFALDLLKTWMKHPIPGKRVCDNCLVDPENDDLVITACYYCQKRMTVVSPPRKKRRHHKRAGSPVSIDSYY